MAIIDVFAGLGGHDEVDLSVEDVDDLALELRFSARAAFPPLPLGSVRHLGFFCVCHYVIMSLLR